MNASDYALKAATRRLLERVGGCVQAAHVTRVGKSTLHRYGDPQAPDFMPIDIVLQLEVEAGEPLVSHELARIQGWDMVEKEHREEDDHGLKGAQIELWEMGRDIADALTEAETSNYSPRALERVASAYDRWKDRFGWRLTTLRRLMAGKKNVVAIRKESA